MAIWTYHLRLGSHSYKVKNFAAKAPKSTSRSTAQNELREILLNTKAYRPLGISSQIELWSFVALGNPLGLRVEVINALPLMNLGTNLYTISPPM